MNRMEFLSRFHHVKTVQAESDFPLKEPGRPAAVLIPLIDNGDKLTVLFTERAKHLKHHAGQVSFPGGKQEAEDADLIHTALRETEEEIGIATDLIEVIGTLPKFRTISRYEVLPIIGFVNPTYKLTLDHDEVESVFEVPLSYLVDQENHFIHWAKRHNRQHPIYFIPWQSKTIWGATASFVRTLSNHLDNDFEPI